MPIQPPIHGYILAGGQSSRMGTDKAVLPFGSSTLLDRASAALQLFCSDVTVVGRAEHPSTPRAIPDHITSAGPVAGIVSALADLAERRGTWAFFVPVDVPLLPGDLLRALVTDWLSHPLIRIAFPVADGTPQPVISLIHVAALAPLQHSLDLNQRRLRPALETAAAHLAEQLAAPVGNVLHTPTLATRDGFVLANGLRLPWQPSPEQLAIADLWFANANTPAELERLRGSAT